MKLFLSILFVIGASSATARAQGNYEIQVYGTDMHGSFHHAA